MNRTISKAQWWQRVQGIRNIQEARREALRIAPAPVSAYIAALVFRPVKPDFMRVTVS